MSVYCDIWTTEYTNTFMLSCSGKEKTNFLCKQVLNNSWNILKLIPQSMSSIQGFPSTVCSTPVKKYDKHYFNQVFKVNINNHKPYCYLPLISCDKNGTLPLRCSSQNHNLSLILRKTSDKFQYKVIWIYLNNTSQNFQGHQK